MKHLLHRSLALLLAVLLLASIVPELALASPPTADPDPDLGTFSGDMLSGGGRLVSTEDGMFYIGEKDGYIYNTLRGKKPVYAGKAELLNYREGVLYFARPAEKSFDLVSFDVSSGRETVLLQNFSGSVRQLYLVGAHTLCFLSQDAIWTMEIGDELPRLLLQRDGLWSFVPTGLGLVYAVGSLLDYTIYAGDRLVAAHTDNYYVDFDIRGGILIYSLDGVDYEAPLTDCFAGTAEAAEFRGQPASAGLLETAFSGLRFYDEEAAAEAEYQAVLALEAAYAEEYGEEPTEEPIEEPAAEPAAEPVEEPTAEPVEEPAEEPVEEPAEEPVEEPAEETAEEPTEEPTEVPIEEPAEEPVEEPVEQPAEEPTEEPTEEPEAVTAQDGVDDADEPAAVIPPEYVPTDKDLYLMTGLPEQVLQFPAHDAQPQADTSPRRAVSASTENIIKRARQMLNVEWTPQKTVRCWKYGENGVLYRPGVKYKGLPYGQLGSYVPWSTSLTQFVAQVNNPDSWFYTRTCGSGSATGPYYSTDCSAFVSWAWNLPGRCTTYNIATYGTLISSSSYADIQPGDMLLCSYHVILVTDVTYNANGVVNGIELSHANPTVSANCCCNSNHYTSLSGLSYYLRSGYVLYRRRANLSDVTYTHECVVPLPGDECPNCGEGMFLKPGIDVSEANGEIEWSRASRYIDFALIRVGYSTGSGAGFTTNRDSHFAANVNGCVANGLPFGLYYDTYAATPAQAQQEMEFVLAAIGEFYMQGIYPELPVFCRIGDNSPMLAQSVSDRKSSINTFCMGPAEAGLHSGVYASTAVWNNSLYESDYNNWYRWVTQPGTACTASAGAHVWQFSISGSVPGIEGTVNLDYCFDSLQKWEHRYKTVTTSATCTGDGSVGYYCMVKGCNRSENRPLPALGHDWNNGAVTTQPTCTAEGVRTFTCSRCAGTVTEPIAALGHNWDSGAVAKEPGCTEPGIFRYTCARCSLTRDEAIAPVGHVWKLTEILTEAESSHAGMGLYTCDRCAETKEARLCAAEVFTDMPAEGTWAHAPIDWAYFHGITSGKTPTTFAPKSTVTRAEAVTFLWTALGRAEPETEGAPFTDVPSGKYYSTPVLWAVENGVTGGTGDGTTFSPRATCTRAQIVTFLWAAAGRPEPESAENPFTDVSEGKYYYKPVLWAVENGITGGTGEGVFSPNKTCTRAQIVTFLYKAFGQTGE